MVIDILCTSLVNQALNWTNEQERDRRTDKEEERQRDRGRETDFRPTFILFAIQRNRRPLV